MTKTTTFALTTAEAISLASSVAAGATLTSKQVASVLLTVKTNHHLPIETADVLLDAVEAVS